MARPDRKRRPDEPRKEYGFSAGVRGKYATRLEAQSNVVVLEPDVAAEFPDSEAVNRALRAVVRATRRRTRRPLR